MTTERTFTVRYHERATWFSFDNRNNLVEEADIEWAWVQDFVQHGSDQLRLALNRELAGHFREEEAKTFEAALRRRHPNAVICVEKDVDVFLPSDIEPSDGERTKFILVDELD